MGQKAKVAAVPAELATLEHAQAHFARAQAPLGRVPELANPGIVTSSRNAVLWTAGCERQSRDVEGRLIEPGDEDSEVHTEKRLCRFAGFVTEALKDDPLNTSHGAPRCMSGGRGLRDKTCASPGCTAPVYWPCAATFRAACRAPLRSDDCFYSDGLLAALGLHGCLEGERMLDLGGAYEHDRETEKYAETCALTSDLDELSVCGAGHIFGVASVSLSRMADGMLLRNPVAVGSFAPPTPGMVGDKDRSADPDLKDDASLVSPFGSAEPKIDDEAMDAMMQLFEKMGTKPPESAPVEHLRP